MVRHKNRYRLVKLGAVSDNDQPIVSICYDARIAYVQSNIPHLMHRVVCLRENDVLEIILQKQFDKL